MKETRFGLHVFAACFKRASGGGESNKIQMILRRTQRFELNLLAIQICLSSFQINPSNNRKEFVVDFQVKKEFPQTSIGGICEKRGDFHEQKKR